MKVAKPEKQKFLDNYENSDLSELFNDLVGDWSLRWNAEKDLILNTFDDAVGRDHEFPQVLETSLGLGLEVSFLLRERMCRVLGNELDSNFLRIAKDAFKDKDLNIDFSSYRWVDMMDNLRKNYYHIILCLGNSFNYIESKRDQVASLISFKEVMHKNGKLIIDIRNWDDMLPLAKSLLDSGQEVSSQNYQYDGKPMYNGDFVKGFPVELGDDWIRFEYIDSRNGKCAQLTMSTIGHLQMMELFKSAELNVDQVYSDFKPGVIKNSHFRQYVLSK